MEIIIIVLFNVILYGLSIKHGLVCDDIRQYERVKKGYISDINIWKYPIEKIKRLLYSGGMFGVGHVKRDHAFRIFLHTTICVLMYLALGRDQISLMAALVYACHSANNQTSLWLNGRRYAVNIIIVLLMILFKPLGILLYPATSLFQVSAVFAPILYGGWWFLLVPVVILICWKDVKTKIDTRLKAVYTDDLKKYSWKRLIIIVKTYGFYFVKMIFPGKCFLIYPDLYFWGLSKDGNKEAYSLNRLFWQGILAAMISVCGAFYFKEQLFYMWIFMILSTLQWCNIISATQQIADRYISLPNVFMTYFISYLIHVYFGFYAVPILASLIVYHTVHLNYLMPMYKDIGRFYDYHNFHQPMNVHCNCFKSHWYNMTGRAIEGFAQLMESHRHNRKDFKTLFLLSEACRMMCDFNGARHFIQLAGKSPYIGQEEVTRERVKLLLKEIFIEEEMDKINRKVSKLSSKDREEVEKLYNQFTRKANEKFKMERD